jgi:UV DNA damage endonuclease
MIVRFGYVAMSVEVKNASPSKTMTASSFNKLTDREAAIRKLERIAAENLHNTLRLLRHNKAHDIQLYRFSSKLIPLLGHEMLSDWQPIPALAPQFAEVGDYVKEHRMRVSFHPDHYTVLSTPREDVLQKSADDLNRHVSMLEVMGLDERAKLNIHIGGSYGDKAKAMDRFLRQFQALAPRIRSRITLENDDKTFNAKETLEACEKLGVPMVLDIHHHAVNNEGENAVELWPRIMETWSADLPPKIHVSSPKSEKDPRGHADYLNPGEVAAFLKAVAPFTSKLDVMIEAKMKDAALFQFMDELKNVEGVKPLDQASVEIR